MLLQDLTDEEMTLLGGLLTTPHRNGHSQITWLELLKDKLSNREGMDKEVEDLDNYIKEVFDNLDMGSLGTIFMMDGHELFTVKSEGKLIITGHKDVNVNGDIKLVSVAYRSLKEQRDDLLRLIANESLMSYTFDMARNTCIDTGDESFDIKPIEFKLNDEISIFAGDYNEFRSSFFVTYQMDYSDYHYEIVPDVTIGEKTEGCYAIYYKDHLVGTVYLQYVPKDKDMIYTLDKIFSNHVVIEIK